ncbi:MAG TPA: ribosome small subunit-dependent GTPase A [Dehalococcoidia bacterium]|nr:ribosome small subunit-dependent GTPase A [Dehalococcoidia bacterium]
MNSHTLGDPASPFLVSLGWNEHFSSHFSEHHSAGLKPGRVARVDRISSMVLTENGSVRGEPSTDMLYTSDKEQLPAVGDWVGMMPRPRHDTDSIEVVLPRRSVLARARGGSDSRSAAREIQIIAANVDFVFATHTVIKTNIARLVRDVAQIEQSGSTPVVLLTKSDLLVDPSELLEEIENTAPGLRVHLTSGLTGDRVDELRQYLTGNRTIVFIGTSGVGKSTISNQLLGGELLATREVREYDGKGRHTTTARHLMPIPGGGVLIDTPGMRTFTLQNAEESISEAFGDISELAETCGFRDCRHEGEPGCAVQAAIAGGALNSERFASFLKLGGEMQHERSKIDKASYAEDRTRTRNRTNSYKKNIKKRGQ